MRKPIVLTTINANYHHTAFGLRYIFANMEELTSQCELIEFTLNNHPRQIVEQILGHEPQIVGFGVYIWNAEETYKTVSILKKIRPELVIVLGGPEISYETETQRIFEICDYVIKGEADELFPKLCRQILVEKARPEMKIITGSLPNLATLKLPYKLYTDEDIRNRTIYVEASRGCPYKCEYCLSSLDKVVRSFSLDSFLGEIEILIQRGAKQFKFVDRTFNLSIPTSTKILNFFLQHMSAGLFLHFEMVPDRLPVELKELILKFPQGSLQFEVGIQTLNPEVARNISRKNDLTKVAENLMFLKHESPVHTHADLIVGLPGETISSFGAGFNQLLGYQPDEIQVGILKRLKGTPIARHEKTFELNYSEHQPFEILSTKDMSFSEIQRMQRFAKFWDLYANNGRYPNLLARILKTDVSPFDAFFNFVIFLEGHFAQTHSIHQDRLMEVGFNYLITKCLLNKDDAAKIILADLALDTKRVHAPMFLKRAELGVEIPKFSEKTKEKDFLPKRQQRHQPHSESSPSL